MGTPFIAEAAETTPVVVPREKTVKELVEEEFGPGHVMVKVARCESQFRQFNENDVILRGRVNSKDVGVFQINEGYHQAAATKLELDIHTLEGNIAYSRHLYDSQGTKPWVWSKPCWNK